MVGTHTVAAAGGVVWRGNHKSVEVALVHRPRYDDWTLPKGKLAEDETELAAAVREIGEEIGSTVAVSRRIGRIRYDVEGVRKTVTYWVMRDLGGEFRPNAEVDEMVWLTPGKARRRLSYDQDRAVVADFASLPMPDSVLILLRHAKAGKRVDWDGDDALRPLDADGVRQARDLVQLLVPFRPTRIVSADLRRCEQTVVPLAEHLGVDVSIEPAFADARFVAAPDATYSAMLALAKPGEVTVICSQGVTIPALIDRFAAGGRSSETRKGAAWVLSIVDGDVVAADYYDTPR